MKSTMRFRLPLSIGALASAAVGIEILLTDSDLWEAAPSHAYGLIGFVLIDFAIVGLLLRMAKVAFRIAMVWGVVQFAVMLGDITTAQSSGFKSTGEFIEYLFSLWNFDLLILLQPMIAALGFLGFRTQRRLSRTTISGR